MKPPARRRRCTLVPMFEMERATVRTVVGKQRFPLIEALRALYPAGEEHDELFWRLAREEVLRQVQTLPDPVIKLVPATIGRVCAMLRMNPEHVDQLLLTFDLHLVTEAAEANGRIVEFRRDARYQDLWTRAIVQRNPPMRVEFEHAIVLGTINDAGAIAKSKTWGRIIKIEGLRPTDQLYPMNITYVLKASSRQRMRWEFRDTFKNILGSSRRLVSDAMRKGKRSFIEQLTAEDARTIWTKLELREAQFWDAVRHGDKFGQGGIEAFIERLEQTSKGYRLDFDNIASNLVQIQPSR
jgi:hypothetical protein